MHDHADHTHVRRERASGPERTANGDVLRRLACVLALTAAYTVAEVVGGILTGSLALLADAGHMMTDNAALALALLATWFARRPPDPDRTYGWQRAEILAALANGVGLAVICGFIAWEAVERFRAPREIAAGPMAVIAAGGLLVNIIGAVVLHGAAHGLNVRAALAHLIGDLLGSVGALTAAILIAFRGWLWADPAASLFIAAIVVFSAARVTLDAINVLMEGVPSHIDAEQVRECLLETTGVGEVHDLHVWSLAGGSPLLTAHLVSDGAAPAADILRQATRRLAERFGITHATLQIEPPDFNIVDGLVSRSANPGRTGPPARGEAPRPN